MRVYLRGTAFDSSEAGQTLLTVNGTSRGMPQRRGLNTVVLHPDGTHKIDGSHDVYGNAVLWNSWADWLRSVARQGDIIAVGSYDAVRNAPAGGSASQLLRGIGATRGFALEKGTDWRRVRTPYALLFVYGDDNCREDAQPHRGPGAHLRCFLNRVELRGSAFDSPAGNVTHLKVNGVSWDLPAKRGLNSAILGPDTRVKARATHDVYGNRGQWDAWAKWINDEASEGDTVAVASYDAVRNAPDTGVAANLLRTVGAHRAFRVEKGADWRRVRSPYALLFVRGERNCLEAAEPHRGNNAYVRTTLLSDEDTTRSRRPVLRLDGSTNYLSGEVDVEEGAFTVSIWFRTTAPDTGLFSVDAGDRGTNGHDRHLYLRGGNVCARLWSNEVIATTGGAYADGQWHRLTYAFGGPLDGQRLYLDGELRARGSKNKSDFHWQDGVNIGYSNDATNQYFSGEIAEVSIWSVVRGERDIKAWKERVVGNEVGLSALYLFGERTGDTVADSRPGGTPLTIHGIPDWEIADDFPGEFLLPVTPEDLTEIRAEAEELARAGTTLGQGRPSGPPDEIPAVPLSELISGGGLPQFAMVERLRSAIVDDELTLNQAVLGQFGSIGAKAADIIDLFVSIRRPRIDLIVGEPGMVGAPGMEVVDEPGSSEKLATPEDHMVRLSGQVTYFNNFPFDVNMDFFHYKGKPGAVFKVQSVNPLGIGTMLPGVPLLQALKVKTPTLIVCNVGTLYDPSLDSGIDEGFNFFGNMDIGASDDPAMRFIGSVMKVREMAVHGSVDQLQLSQRIVVEAAFHRDITIVEGDSFRVAYTRSDVGIELSGAPLEPTVSMSNDLVVTLRKDGEETHLVFTGGNKFQAESVSGFFTMNGTGRHPEGALTGEVQSSGEWKEPFGIPGITLRQLSVQVGGTYAAPWIDNIGVHGNLQVGTVDGSMSILVDSNDPDQFVLAGSTDKITLLEVLSFMSPLTFVAYQATPPALQGVMNKVVDVKMEDVKLNIVPSATSIGGVHFRDEGITFAGKLTAWGWKASAFINVDTFDGITARLDMDPVDLLGVFKITGGAGDPAPALRLSVTPHSTPYLYGSGKIYLLGLSREVRLEAGANGLTFDFRERWGSIMSLNLACTYGDYNFRAAGDIDFDLNVTIPTRFGDIKLVDVGFKAAAEIRAGVTDGFYLSAAGDFRFYGKDITFPTLHLRVAPRDFQGLYNEVLKVLRDKALDIFLPVFGTLEEWANAVKQGLIAFGGEVASVARNVYQVGKEAAAAAAKTIGRTANQIAEGLKSVYGATAPTIIATLQGLRFGATAVAGALRSTFAYGAAAAARALKQAGYALAQITDALRAAFGAVASTLASALKYAGYAAKLVGQQVNRYFRHTAAALAKLLRQVRYAIADVASAVKSIFNLLAHQLSSALRLAGYAVRDVAKRVKAIFRLSSKTLARALKQGGYAARAAIDGVRAVFTSLTSKSAAAALKYAGYAVKDVGKAVKGAFSLGSKELAKAMKGAGYTAKQVGQALQGAFNIGAKGVGTALKYAGFGVKETGKFLKDAYNLGPKALNTALKGAGYAAGEIGDFFKSLGGSFASFFGGVVDTLNPTNW